MADDGKRTEVVSTKVTERVALDLLKLCAMHDRSPSEYMYLLIRKELYGEMVRFNAEATQPLKVYKVDE